MARLPYIDQQRCSGCGLCLPVCPEEAIRLVGGKAEVAGDGCMGCGHCQAACPQQAVSLADMPVALGLRHVSERLEWLAPGRFDTADLVQLLRSRRSVRTFQAREVPLSLLEDLVKIGSTAPSGTNSQAWTFTILKNRHQVEWLGGLTAAFFRRVNRRAAKPLWRLAARLFAGDSLGRYYRRHYDSVAQGLAAWDERGEDRLFHGAPAAILVGGESGASCPAEDALLAAGHILLAAHSLGLSTCLIGFVVEAIRHDRCLAREVGVGRHEQIYAVIAVGYGAEKYHSVAGRRPVAPRSLP